MQIGTVITNQNLSMTDLLLAYHLPQGFITGRGVCTELPNSRSNIWFEIMNISTLTFEHLHTAIKR